MTYANSNRLAPEETSSNRIELYPFPYYYEVSSKSVEIVSGSDLEARAQLRSHMKREPALVIVAFHFYYLFDDCTER